METLIVTSYRLFMAVLSMILAGALTAAAAPPGKKQEPLGAVGPIKRAGDETPLHITAARLEADQNAGWVLFSGNVKAVHGDSTLYADNLWVYFDAKPKPQAPAAGGSQPTPEQGKKSAPEGAGASPLTDMGSEKINRIVARGQVRFVQDDRVATGQEGIYYKDKEEVVLLGNPQLWRGENTLKGERIIFNLKSNTMQVESSPQKRVEAHLFSTAKGPAGVKREKGIAAGTAVKTERKVKPGKVRKDKVERAL